MGRTELDFLLAIGPKIKFKMPFLHSPPRPLLHPSSEPLPLAKASYEKVLCPLM